MKYRKKPVEVEAIQFTGNNEIQCMDFVGKKLVYSHPPRALEYDKDITNDMVYLLIPSREGDMKCDRYDWIIKGNTKEAGDHFWVNKPDYFESAYEEVGYETTVR